MVCIQHPCKTLGCSSQRHINYLFKIDGSTAQEGIFLQSITVPWLNHQFLTQFLCNIRHRSLEISSQETISNTRLHPGVGNCYWWWSKWSQPESCNSSISQRKLSCKLMFLYRSQVNWKSQLVVRILPLHLLKYYKEKM